jgi:N,N'-diacetyllegionaminate synthase
LPYLKKIAQFKKQVIISTGMCTIAEISDAVNIFIDGGTLADNITILHCNTEYPTPMKDVNLLAMNSIRDEFKVDVGYSDHTLGIEIPIAAVALGATVIEKHFTLDRSMEGPDHIASLIPAELKQMVKAIRNVEMALGSDVKQPSESELKNKIIARKSIHLAHALKKGHIITEGDLVMKRPGDGISPMQMFKIVGGALKRDLPGDSKLEMGDLA